MNTFEVLNGKLYALAKDPDNPGYSEYIRCTTTSCSNGYFTGTRAYHVYSATQLGSDLYMAGSANEFATIWKSTDDGLSWTSFFQRAPYAPPTGVYDGARYYNIGAYQSKIHVHSIDFESPHPPFSDIFTGTSRSNGPELFPGTQSPAKVFAGKLVSIKDLRLKEFDGTITKNSVYEPFVRDYTISGGYLFVLNRNTHDSYIYRSKDLITWNYVDTAPVTAESLEILNGKLYVGTNDSKLYRSDRDPFLKVNMAPINYLLLLDD